MAIPQYSELFVTVVDALIANGGAATNAEIDIWVEDELLKLKKITAAEAIKPHDPVRPDRTEVRYRLAWARTYLKKTGFLENSERGVWALTAKGRSQKIASAMIVKEVQSQHRKATDTKTDAIEIESLKEEVNASWEQTLLTSLKAIEPAAFERLCQRLLRECGFTHVEVTGKVGDGGIDGRGIMKLGDLLSFHVFFQCKRYDGQVSAGAMRDFRGAMVGRGDKGLLITTGGFTRDAVKEATRDGTPPIELVDGDALCSLLKVHRMGVTTELVERTTVDVDWFKAI